MRDIDGVLLGGVVFPADEADGVLFDLGDLRTKVLDVSNCLFTEFVAIFCFFTGTEGAGGDGDSGELSSDRHFLYRCCTFLLLLGKCVLWERWHSSTCVNFSIGFYLIFTYFKIVLILIYWYFKSDSD